MPVSYRIDRERGWIETRCSGDVTLPQVRSHFDELQADPRCPRQVDVLLDLTGTTSLPTGPQIRAAADRVSLVDNIVFEACAIVAGSETWFSLARMFEDLVRGYFAEIRTFRKRSEAEQWLLSLHRPGA
jgi:hypothetical protein